MSLTRQPASGLVWFKSSYSGGNATECVECAYSPHDAWIRDSKHADGPTLKMRGATWGHFVDAIRRDWVLPH